MHNVTSNLCGSFHSRSKLAEIVLTFICVILLWCFSKDKAATYQCDLLSISTAFECNIHFRLTKRRTRKNGALKTWVCASSIILPSEFSIRFLHTLFGRNSIAKRFTDYTFELCGGNEAGYFESVDNIKHYLTASSDQKLHLWLFVWISMEIPIW